MGHVSEGILVSPFMSVTGPHNTTFIAPKFVILLDSLYKFSDICGETSGDTDESFTESSLKFKEM